MHKCKVNAYRITMTVCEGSVVLLDEQQYEAVKKYVTELPEVETAVAKPDAETAVKPKRRVTKKQ